MKEADCTGGDGRSTAGSGTAMRYQAPGRHVLATGKHLDVQRLRVLPVDPVAHAAKPCEVAHVLL